MYYLLVHSSKYLKYLGLGQAGARNQELNFGLP